MESFELATLVAERIKLGRPYLEFLRVPALSAGLYVLEASSIDQQKPHTEDEVYYVVEGQGAIRVADEDGPVGPGTVVYVAAGVEHRFHSITKDLKILVVFAPMRGSRPSPVGKTKAR